MPDLLLTVRNDEAMLRVPDNRARQKSLARQSQLGFRIELANPWTHESTDHASGSWKQPSALLIRKLKPFVS